MRKVDSKNALRFVRHENWIAFKFLPRRVKKSSSKWSKIQLPPICTFVPDTGGPPFQWCTARGNARQWFQWTSLTCPWSCPYWTPSRPRGSLPLPRPKSGWTPRVPSAGGRRWGRQTPWTLSSTRRGTSCDIWTISETFLFKMLHSDKKSSCQVTHFCIKCSNYDLHLLKMKPLCHQKFEQSWSKNFSARQELFNIKSNTYSKY